MLLYDVIPGVFPPGRRRVIVSRARAIYLLTHISHTRGIFSMPYCVRYTLTCHLPKHEAECKTR
jgi:hypothetical protein